MSRLAKFINQTAKDLGGVATAEFWPLTPGQLLAYFDANFLFDFYNRYQRLQRREIEQSALSKFFDSSDQIYDLLVNFACIGFKVGSKFNIQNVSFAERVKFFEEMLALAEFKLKKEWGTEKVRQAMKLNWLKIDASNRLTINRLKTALFGLNWTWYYDVFATLGSDIYGPFKVKYQGKNYFLLINDYFNQKPVAVWPVAKSNNFSRVRAYSLIRPFKYKKTVFGRYKTSANIGQLAEYVYIERDGRPLNLVANMEQLIGQIAIVRDRQYKFVERLSALAKVDKAVLMYYWRYREIFGHDWRKLYLRTRKNLKIFGNTFIKNTPKAAADLTLTEKRRKFDPRNNHF